MKHFFANGSWASGALWARLFLLSSFLFPVLAQAQSTTVVISELYVAGSSSAAFKNDYVELYNQNVTDIDLSGYTLQYHSSAIGGNYVVVSLGGKTIPANGYLLVQFGPTAASGNPLPTPDVSTNTVLSNGSGRVALVNSTTPLPDTSPANAAGIVDFVGYGPAPVYEGTASVPTAVASKSLERKAQSSSTVASMGAAGSDVVRGNSYDTNDNLADFITRNAPDPQNSASPTEELVPPTVFYNTKNPAGALDILSTFSSTPDGVGPSPTNFSTDYQRFIVSGSTATIAGSWAVTGTKTKVMLLANSTFTLPAAAGFSGLIDIGSGATLVVKSSAPGMILGNLEPTSTVEYSQAAFYTVPVPVGPGYGNLTLRNASKVLGAGTTTVRGNLLIDNVGATGSNVFGGAPGSASQLNLGGNLTLTGPVNFSSVADDRIALTATNTGTAQVLNGGGNTIKLLKVTLPASQGGLALTTGTTNLELGSSTGGGYQLAPGTVLTVNNNTLSFATNSKAAIASGAANTGALALSPGSSLSFGQNNNANLGTLLLTPASTQLTNLAVNATGGTTTNNTLTLASSLTVTGTLNLAAGTLAIGPGNVLTLNGPVSSVSGLLRGAPDADLVIAGAGALGSIRLPGGTGGQLQNFSLNRAGQTLALGSNLVVNTAATLTAGILDLAGNNLTINGTVATTTTGLLHGSSASNLYIGGTGVLGTVAFTPTGGLLNALVLNRPGGTLAIVGAPLQVDYPTLTSGILSLGAGVALTITGTAALPDPAVAQYAVTPTSILNFTGSGAIGTLAFVPGQDQLQGLTLARLSGAVATGQLVTNLTVTSLTLTRGNLFVQGAAKLTVLPSGGVSGGGIFSYVNTLTLSAVTNTTTSTVALNFPLGDNGQYRGLTLTLTDQVIGTTTYTARQYEGPSPTRTLPATLARVSGIRYFNLVPEAGGTSTLLSAKIRLSYSASNDFVTPANVNLLRVAMTDPADNTKWKDIGGTGGGTDITSASFPAGPLGDFTLATDITTPVNTNPLPVELLRVAALRQAGAVAVTWATASEQNSAYFEVQRSLNGQEFATVASTAAQGRSTQLTAYAVLDKTAPAAQLYYRLRQVDVDGTVAFSTVVAVAGTDKPLALTLYPNPTTDRVIATLPAAEGRSFRVLNAVGQVLAQGAAATVNPTVDVRHLPAGTYFMELRSDAGRQTCRFVKND